MADDLTIEVTASAGQADAALAGLIKRFDEFQTHIDSITPSVTKFTERLNSVASSSKAFKQFESVKRATQIFDQFGNVIATVSAKTKPFTKAGQDARQSAHNIQQAVESMQKTVAATSDPVKNLSLQIDVQRQKMAQLQQKYEAVASKEGTSSVQALNLQSRILKVGESVDQLTAKLDKMKSALASVDDVSKRINTTAFSMSPSDFVAKYSHTGQGNNSASSVYPGEDEGPLPAGAPSKTTTEIFNERTPASSSVHIDTTQAQSALEKVQEFIDRLNPAISGMSAEAQTQFNALASKLSLVSQRIDNQRALYHQLATAATQAAQASGENSSKYLSLEKRMLAADVSMDRLIATQEKLKAQMSSVAGVANETGIAVAAAGSKSEAAGKKAESGWSKALGMFERMGIRIAAFRAFSAVSQGIATGIQNMALASPQANATMSQLATSVQYLQNSIAAALMPVLRALTPVIVQVADAISWAANQLAIFIAQVTGQKTVTIATKSYVDYAKSLNKTGDNASDASKKVKELQRTIMGFDELNVLNKNVNDALASSPKSNTPDYSSMFKTIPTPPSNFDLSKMFKDVPKVFDKLKDAADKGGKALDKVKDKAKELEKELEKVKLPVLGDWKVPSPPVIPAFPSVPAPEIEKWKIPALPKIPDFPPVKAPVIPPIKVPAWDFGGYDNSKQKYQQPVMPPAVLVAIAPAIILNAFLASRAEYQKTITPPTIQRTTAPAVDLSSNFTPSLSLGLANLQAWSANALIALDQWGKNTRANFKTTFDNVILTVDTALNGISKNESKWIGSASSGFALFGMNVAKNIQTAFSNVYSNVMKTLDKMWNRYSTLMSIMGKTISVGWDTKNVGMVLEGVALAGITVAPIILSGVLAGAANGAFVTGDSLLEVGEGKDNEAVLPLNPSVFSQIAQGIQENSSSGGISDSAVSGINNRLDNLEAAIIKLAQRPVNLYSSDRKIAESSNAGNRELARAYGHLPAPFE